MATNFTGGAAMAAAMVRQPDGKLVVAGTTVDANQQNEFALARYLSDDQGSMHTGDPNQRWLSQLYLDLLQRPVDPSGLQT